MSVVSFDAENLDSIESQEVGPDEEEVCFQMCPICLDVYVSGDSISWSKNQTCRHAFHKSCIEGWLKQLEREGCCPCCRGPYLTKNKSTERENEQEVNHEIPTDPLSQLASSEDDTGIKLNNNQCDELSNNVEKVMQPNEKNKSRTTESSYFCTVHGLMR